MTQNRIWLLPSRSDPEAAAIERLLAEAGEETATSWDDPRVASVAIVYAIERTDWPAWAASDARVRRIDHHAPGDPGYGRPPAEFLAASSIGQVVQELARIGKVPASWRRMPPGRCGSLACGVGAFWLRPDGESPHSRSDAEYDTRGWTLAHDVVLADGYFHRVPREILYTAAADHCLGAAYRGECPGVDPDALMRWRVESRAAHQGRSPEQILADIEAAREILREAPIVRLAAEPWEPACGVHGRSGACWQSGAGDPSARTDECYALGDPFAVADLRGRRVPELPEAAAREGICFIATVEEGGRTKVVCQAGTPEQVEAFMHWAPTLGLVDTYGDPARGFAGGYLRGTT